MSTEVDLEICKALGATASEAVMPRDNPHSVLYVYEFEEDVAGLQPDFVALLAASEHCVIVTAPGNECDFVSRFFGPQVGINEDPVTGSDSGRTFHMPLLSIRLLWISTRICAFAVTSNETPSEAFPKIQ